MSAVSKPDLGNGISHPARYSKGLIPLFAELLGDAESVLDPFAGTGRIHELTEYGYDTTGIEIEPEWATMHPRTVCGDALDLPFASCAFDAIVTSCTYGNRMADHHEAKDGSIRRSYTHDLGRQLAPTNSGAMQWGSDYRTFHVKAWREALRVLKPNGTFILNIKDHQRAGQRQYVAGWHVTTLCRLGLSLQSHQELETPNMRAGANAAQRFNEQVYVFIKDANAALPEPIALNEQGELVLGFVA